MNKILIRIIPKNRKFEDKKEFKVEFKIKPIKNNSRIRIK
jgi:hypothetical protein